MKLVVADFETFWSQTHSLSKMNPIEYVLHPETEIISLAIKVGNGPTIVLFGEEDIQRHLDSIDWSDVMLVGHNMSAFDAMVFAWRFGVSPKVWGCTLAMAKPIHAKTCGVSLNALVKHYGLGVKNNTALLNTKGKHLCDFTQQELVDMAVYNEDDTEQCHGLFYKLKGHYNAMEFWQIDASIRMMVDPKFVLNRRLLEATLSAERVRKHRGLVELGRMMYGNDFEDTEYMIDTVKSKLMSAAHFSKILKSLDEPVPVKPSPSNPDKMIPALAKTDEAFLAMQESDNELVALAASCRLEQKSTLLQTRIETFISVGKQLRGRLPIPLHYCGADTTGRWSGFIYNPQNLPRVDPEFPKPSDALRKSMVAPPGHKVVVADLSGIELRVNHFLWKVPSSMALYKASPDKADLYKEFARNLYSVSIDEVSKQQRRIGKVAQLGLGFGSGWKTFKQVAKVMGSVKLDDQEAQETTYGWRDMYPEITQAWRHCHALLPAIANGDKMSVDPWGLVRTEKEALVLPSGRRIRYPDLRQEQSEKDERMEWWYGHGRKKARIYAGKIVENIVQALARDIIAQNAYDVFRETKYRPSLLVHDELVYVAPDDAADDLLETVHRIMRTPPTWWPELIVWSEGDIAQTYGDAK